MCLEHGYRQVETQCMDRLNAENTSFVQVGLQMGVLDPAGESGPTKMATKVLKKKVHEAATLYGTDTYKQLQRNCMTLDVSWRKPAEVWEEVGHCLSLLK